VPGDPRVAFVDEVAFEGPFPENLSLMLAVPAGLRDDAGRTLANQASFPLKIETDEVLRSSSSLRPSGSWNGMPMRRCP
jgi:hypothetical protein